MLNMLNTHIDSLGKNLALNLFVYNNANSMLGNIVDSSSFAMPFLAKALYPQPAGRRKGAPPLHLRGREPSFLSICLLSPSTLQVLYYTEHVLDASGCSMLAPLQTGAARFSSYLLSRARKVLGSHLFSPCGVPEFCSISTRKLAAHGFGASMAAMVSFPPQRYHYFLVLDFEATCDKPQIHPQEIIEFPILKLNGRTMEIESTFHMYVQPVVHPQLTPFCTELTGIIQAMVDGQPSLQQVLERVDEWMAKEGLLDPNVKSIFVTCGDWDLKVMLPGQCQYLGLPVADYFKQWINLKKAYSFAMGCWPKNGLLDMNKGLSLQHIGRPHSGIGQFLHMSPGSSTQFSACMP
ncbi:ERI1 exoribonuclease 3 [Tupaia chinensis]|uniref:ERI1 exoribonuclease 3 n=1 Tax=Tupaia chinensis TaxID=246437 RepID=L9KLZ1_TUPCH|nr:ERI1 exoribonuclease 3 [Tupaia chinensis]